MLQEGGADMAYVNPYEMSPQELLARTIMGEAGGESPLGQRAVASVIANRVASPSHPNSYTEAILAPRQFSVWNDVTGELNGRGSNTAWQGVIPPNINQLAADVIAGNYEDPTNGALNYANPAHSDPSNQGWIRNMSNQTQIGNHLFGTAGGSSSVSGGGGSGSMVGSGGDDRLVDVGSEGPQTIGGRIQQFFGKGNNSGNPTVAAKRYDAAAERAFDRAESSMDVFDSNAPVSWTNVFGTLGNRAMGGINEKRAAEQQSEATARVQELMASGDLSPETIAQVMALDPEMGRAMQGQAWAVANREDQQQFKAGESELNRQHQNQLEETRQNNALAIEKYKSTLPGAELRKIMTKLETQGITEDSPEFAAAYESEYNRLNPISSPTNLPLIRRMQCSCILTIQMPSAHTS